MNYYNILVFGSSGSGKTSFLASMYDKLSVQKPNIGFFVQVPERERKLLVNTYREMEDPSRDWPAGTSDVSEWVFTCAVHGGGNNYPLLQFAYLDYAGGRLTDHPLNGSENVFSIDEAAEDAEAILVLLDGLKILHLLKDTQEKLSSPLYHDLRFILPVVMDHLDKPLHFVITKWDLLENEYSLGEVRDALLKDERFSAIVTQRRTHYNPTRLIPVSAVGNGFASLAGDNLSMIKSSKGEARPFQVEIPIACVLVDGFEIAQRSLSDEQRRQILKKKGVIRRFIKHITGAAETMTGLPLPPQYIVVQSVLRLLFGYANKEIKTSIERLELERDSLIANINTEEKALQSLVLSYHVLISKLETEFPESNLHKA